MRNDIEKFIKSKFFTPLWCENEVEPEILNRAYKSENKSLTTLLAELTEIQNVIEDAKLREWNLGNLLKFHNAGIVKD